MVGLRCDVMDRLSVDDRYGEAITVPLPDDAKEIRLISEGFASVFSVKVSRSNLSASTLESARSSKFSRGGVE